MTEKNAALFFGLSKLAAECVGGPKDLILQAAASIEAFSKEKQLLIDANKLLNDKCERLMKEIAVLEAAQKDRPNMDHLFNKTKGLVEEVKALKQEVEAAKARYADATSLLFQSRETAGRQLDIIENLAAVLDKVSAY